MGFERTVPLFERQNSISVFDWGSFARGKAGRVWTWLLSCIQSRGYEWVELYLHFLIYLHRVDRGHIQAVLLLSKASARHNVYENRFFFVFFGFIFILFFIFFAYRQSSKHKSVCLVCTRPNVTELLNQPLHIYKIYKIYTLKH